MNETIFTEDLDKNQLLITRVFNGPIGLVWRAWTKADLLDQWWAPSPWQSHTKAMNFEAGGQRLYCMQGPKDQQHWGLTKYLKILSEEFFEAEDAFCDENGNINTEIPGSHWEVDFIATENGTEVRALNSFASREAMEQLISMGIKAGTVAVHKHLDELLTEFLASTNK